MEGKIAALKERLAPAAAALRRGWLVAQRLFLAALRIALGGVFLYAGLRKAFATQEFARDIQNYGLIASGDAIIVAAVFLPWLEIAVGGALIVRRLQLGALSIIAGLMIVFTAALASAWARGLDISCGCFSSDDTPASAANYPEWLARDLVLLLTAILLLRIEWRAGRLFDKGPAPEKKS